MSENKPELIWISDGLPKRWGVWDNEEGQIHKIPYILKQAHDKEVADLKTQVHYFSEHAAAFKQDCDRYEEILQGLKNEMASMYSQAAIKLKNEKSRPLSESYIEADTVLNVIDHLHQVLHDLKTQKK